MPRTPSRPWAYYIDSRQEFEPFLRPHGTPSFACLLTRSLDLAAWGALSKYRREYLTSRFQSITKVFTQKLTGGSCWSFPSTPSAFPSQKFKIPSIRKAMPAVHLIGKACFYPIQSLSRESWSPGDMGLREIEYAFAQNREHVTRGGLSRLSSQLPRFVFYSTIC